MTATIRFGFTPGSAAMTYRRVTLYDFTCDVCGKVERVEEGQLPRGWRWLDMHVCTDHPELT